MVRFTLLDFDELLDRGFPVHPDSPGCPRSYYEPEDDEYVDTYYEPCADHGDIYVLDCEMIQTSLGNEVARVTLVDWSGDICIDEIIRPEGFVIDTRYHITGLDEDDVYDAKMTLADIQNKIIYEFLDASHLLIGHALHNDLHVLKIRHPKIVDTQDLYHKFFKLNHTPSLRYLAWRFLHKSIQNGVHDSVEDALATLHLAQKFLSMRKRRRRY